MEKDLNMQKENLKSEIGSCIDLEASHMIALGEHIFKEPELGFKEVKTVDKILNYFKDTEINFEKNISITGFKAGIGNNKGVNIAVLAELDAVPTLGHEFSSADHNAAHSCGHSNQAAIVCCVVKALHNSGLLSQLNGRVTFIGTPAEEFTDFDFRRELVKNKKIEYMSGKQDMIDKGIFDDVDLVISCHSMGGIKGKFADVNGTLNGFLSKRITYYGKASHAGAEPHKGINALNAAMIGLNAVNAQRETFLEEDKVRVHGIITDGGQSVNSIPERVVVEVYVRAENVEALETVGAKVDRAFKAGAYALNAECRIETTPGYLPFHQCKDLSDVIKSNLSEFLDRENILEDLKSTASGDIGDLSYIKPSIQFGFGGFEGSIHCSDFKVVDTEMAYVIPAKAIANTIIDLLWNDNEKAKQILSNHSNKFDKESYKCNWLSKQEQRSYQFND